MQVLEMIEQKMPNYETVNKFLTGSESEKLIASEKIVESFSPMLMSVATKSVRDFHTAEDLVSESLSTFFTTATSFRGEASVKNWIFLILKNKIRDHYKSARMRNQPTSLDSMIQYDCKNGDALNSGDEACEYEEIDEMIDDVVDEKFELRLKILRAFAHMPEREKIIAESLACGAKQKDIAKQLGLSDVQITRYKKTIQRFLKQQGIYY